MSEKNWCTGAGKRVPMKEPTSLVDCPVCARRDLGAYAVRDETYGDGMRRMGAVPNHTARALRPEQIPTMRMQSESFYNDRETQRVYGELPRRNAWSRQ